MSRHGMFKCYYLIIERTHGTFKPSFAELKETLNEAGFEISERTLQRYIDHIRTEFNIEVKYDRNKNCYFIDELESKDIDSFLGFLNVVRAGETLGAKVNKDNLKFIAMDNEVGFKGLDWLDSLLPATQTQKRVKITYQKFGDEKTKAYELQPYLIKEYQNRWYLFARLGDGEPFRTFGLDRIKSVEVTRTKFVRDSTINPRDYFNNIVGLVYDTSTEVEEVQIALTPLQAGYVRSLPVHQSQREISTTKSKIVFSYNLIINYELMQKILMLGGEATVLKPASLKKEIRAIAQRIVLNNK